MNHINELASKGVFWAVQTFLTDNKLTVKEFLTPTKPETVGLILSLLGYECGLEDLTSEARYNLKTELQGIVETAEVYDTPDGVKSHIIGKIEWDTSNVHKEFESWKKLTCANCSDTELVAEYLESLTQECCGHQRAVEPVSDSDEIPQYLFDQEWESFEEGLKEYCQTVYNIPAATHLVIDAGNIDWSGRSGHKSLKIDAKELIQLISIGNDNTIKLVWRDDNTLKGYCAHHDATTHLEIQPAVLCGYSEEAIRQCDWEVHKENAEVVNILLDEEGRYEYLTPESVSDVVIYPPDDCPAKKFNTTVRKLIELGFMNKQTAETLLEDMNNE